METSRQRGVADDLTAASLTERARRKASLKRGGGKGEARERSAFFDDVPFIVEFSYAGRVRCGFSKRQLPLESQTESLVQGSETRKSFHTARIRSMIIFVWGVQSIVEVRAR